jgi:hypothetical protein
VIEAARACGCHLFLALVESTERREQADYIQAWIECGMWGTMNLAALGASDDTIDPLPTLQELRTYGAESYASILSTVATWRRGEAWAVLVLPTREPRIALLCAVPISEAES